MASNVPMTGGYDCKFVDTPPDKLVCQICLLVARTPHQVTCCGRVYCKTCLDEHKRHHKRRNHVASLELEFHHQSTK